jgi:ribosomal protein L32
MAKRKSSDSKRQMREAGSEALEAAQAKDAGSKFVWHYGRVTRLGHYEIAGGRSVSIVWEEGGATHQQGNISEEEWEIFKLAFLTTGRIAVLSDQQGEGWMYDYSFLEAVR